MSEAAFLSAAVLYFVCGTMWAIYYRAQTLNPFEMSKPYFESFIPLLVLFVWPFHVSDFLIYQIKTRMNPTRYIVSCGLENTERFGSLNKAMNNARQKALDLRRVVFVYDFAKDQPYYDSLDETYGSASVGWAVNPKGDVHKLEEHHWLPEGFANIHEILGVKPSENPNLDFEKLVAMRTQEERHTAKKKWRFEQATKRLTNLETGDSYLPPSLEIVDGTTPGYHVPSKGIWVRRIDAEIVEP